MNQKLEVVKLTLKENKLKFILIYIGYIILNSIINQTYVTIPEFFASYKTVFAITFVLTNFLIIPFLVSLTLILAISKFRITYLLKENYED